MANRANGSGKTANKTAKPSGRNGNRLPLGAHPGNTGGKPGRSGRPRQAFKKFCRELANSPEFQKALEEAATMPGSKNFVGAAKIVTSFAASKPPKKHEHNITMTARDRLADRIARLAERN